jgi:polysaccharide export outer membrane protein
MPDWSVDRSIEIVGEVRFPGVYQVTKGETLSQLIERAGGFTDAAFPFGAVFTREKIQQREQEQFERLMMQLKKDVAAKSLTAEGLNSTSPEQSVTLINQLAEQQMVGRLVLNMTQIQAGNPEYDVEVEEGDKLFIPRRNSAISVVGEVQNPGSHSFNANLTVKDYLALSGNSRKRADDERIYVLRADGSVVIPPQSWFAGNQQLMPGDTIIVPLDVEYKDPLSLWSQVTQIFYQSAVALAALNSF